MKKIGIAFIALLLCSSLLIACTPGQTLDRFFSIFNGIPATWGNAGYATNGNYYIYVSNGNAASNGNAGMASPGNVASAGNYYLVSSGNAAGFFTPSPVPLR